MASIQDGANSAVLFQLAEDHLARAGVAAANELAGRESGTNVEFEEIRAAVRCLTASIERAPSDVRARALLSNVLLQYTNNDVEAEHLLAQALQHASTKHTGPDALYGVKYHQIYLYGATQGLAAAEKVAKPALTELLSLERFDWYYRFALAYADILIREKKSVKKCFNHLASAIAEAEKRNHGEPLVVLLLTTAKLALLDGQFHVVQDLITRCIAQFRGRAVEDRMEVDGEQSPAQDPLSPPPLEVADAAVSNTELRMYLGLLTSLYCLHLGRTGLAIEWLCGPNGIDKIIDAAVEGAESERAAGLVKITIPVGETRQQFDVSLLPRTQVKCLSLLAIALARKSTSYSRTKKCLVEGLRTVDACLQNLAGELRLAGPAEIRKSWEWLMNCKVYLLLNLCDVLMLRAEYSDAQAYMTILGNTLARGTFLMERWKQLYFLSWGLLRQSMGEMQEALLWLEGAADPDAPNDDVRISALFNMCLIYIGPKHENWSRATAIWDHLSSYLLQKADSSLQDPQTAALKLAEGAVFVRQKEVQKSKESLLEAIRIAEASQAVQIKTMALGLTGMLFSDSDPEKAEAMLTVAKTLATDCKVDLLAAGLCDALSGVLTKDGRSKEAVKMAKQVEHHMAAHEKKQGGGVKPANTN